MKANTACGKPATELRSIHLERVQRKMAMVNLALPTAGAALAIYLGISTTFYVSMAWLWAAMHLATMLGITAGFHRLAAHRSFSAIVPVKTILLGLGSMASQGPPVYWVSNHRRHHEFSDQPGDPHSPVNQRETAGILSSVKGLVHAHMGWLLSEPITNPMRYSRDLLKDPAVMRVNRNYQLWVLAGLLAPAALGVLILRSAQGGLLGFLWGGLLRVFTVHHTTWCINSLTHAIGQRPFATADNSRNLAWLSLASAGESWHNGHHAFPTSARFGLEWWQLDLGYLLIAGLGMLGLAKDIRIPGQVRIDSFGQRNPADPAPATNTEKEYFHAIQND